MVVEKNIRAHDFLRGGPKWVVIYGTTGEAFINPGYFWVPYIISTDIAVVDDFSPRHNITSRYATQTINNRYYNIITL
jgi:hypothetical protein